MPISSLTIGQYLCCWLKLLKKLVYNKIITNILPKITSKQHSFMPSKSTITQLLATFTDVNTNIDMGRRTYFDLAKAFDSVPHNLLTHKLQQFGIYGPLLNWMTNYLHNRKKWEPLCMDLGSVLKIYFPLIS